MTQFKRPYFCQNLILAPSKTLWWSVGAKVLRKLSMPGRPTNLDNSRARVGWLVGWLVVLGLTVL